MGLAFSTGSGHDDIGVPRRSPFAARGHLGSAPANLPHRAGPQSGKVVVDVEGRELSVKPRRKAGRVGTGKSPREIAKRHSWLAQHQRETSHDLKHLVWLLFMHASQEPIRGDHTHSVRCAAWLWEVFEVVGHEKIALAIDSSR